MAERDASLYGLETITPVVVLSQFQLAESGPTKIAFDVFTSLAEFVANEKEAVTRQQLVFMPEPTADDAPEMMTSASVVHFSPDEMAPYADILNAIRGKALDIVGLSGRGYTLTNFYIDTLGKVMEISADNGKGHRPFNPFTRAEYDRVLAANMDLAGAAIGMAWAFAKSKDAFLAACQPLKN